MNVFDKIEQDNKNFVNEKDLNMFTFAFEETSTTFVNTIVIITVILSLLLGLFIGFSGSIIEGIVGFFFMLSTGAIVLLISIPSATKTIHEVSDNPNYVSEQTIDNSIVNRAEVSKRIEKETGLTKVSIDSGENPELFNDFKNGKLVKFIGLNKDGKNVDGTIYFSKKSMHILVNDDVKDNKEIVVSVK